MSLKRETLRIPDKVDSEFTARDDGLYLRVDDKVWKFEDFAEMTDLFMGIHQTLDVATGYGILELVEDKEPLVEKGEG